MYGREIHKQMKKKTAFVFDLKVAKPGLYTNSGYKRPQNMIISTYNIAVIGIQAPTTKDPLELEQAPLIIFHLEIPCDKNVLKPVLAGHEHGCDKQIQQHPKTLSG